MKWTLMICLLLRTYAIQAQTTTRNDFPDLGEAITTYPAVEWLQGEGITNFDKNKTYVVELWATWCVPCISYMPHLKNLHDKFKDKGIVFIAQNVMESDRDKVKKFVENKKELKDFTVGFSGATGSDFDLKWIKAAGINAIPQTFIIQDNKLLWQTNPAMLNEKVLELLLDHKFSIDAAKALVTKTE